jgi:hypothetical protein
MLAFPKVGVEVEVGFPLWMNGLPGESPINSVKGRCNEPGERAGKVGEKGKKRKREYHMISISKLHHIKIQVRKGIPGVHTRGNEVAKQWKLEAEATGEKGSGG